MEPRRDGRALVVDRLQLGERRRRVPERARYAGCWRSAGNGAAHREQPHEAGLGREDVEVGVSAGRRRSVKSPRAYSSSRVALERQVQGRADQAVGALGGDQPRRSATCSSVPSGCRSVAWTGPAPCRARPAGCPTQLRAPFRATPCLATPSRRTRSVSACEMNRMIGIAARRCGRSRAGSRSLAAAVDAAEPARVAGRTISSASPRCSNSSSVRACTPMARDVVAGASRLSTRPHLLSQPGQFQRRGQPGRSSAYDQDGISHCDCFQLCSQGSVSLGLTSRPCISSV